MNANSTSLIQCLRKMVAPQSCAHMPDPQLLERFLTQRSEAAFAALVQRHGPMVLNVCRRVLHHAEDAEDAFQATFLVLARKAGSIRKHESVGSWLHGVAYRVSRMCKIKEARRLACQREMPLPQSTDALDDIHWRELRSLLDEELGKLPEKYRAPLVLCYLEGRTRDEAAQQLGVSKAVFRRRLEYSRERLGRQLARRGITLSAALSAPLLADAAAQAVLPPLLAASTVRAGLAAATGNTISGIVSAEVVALAESGVASLLAKKASVALVLLVSLAFGVGGLLAYRGVQNRTFAEAPAAPKAAPPAPTPPPARSASKDQAIEIKGRVLDPDGKPFAGARLFLLSAAHQKKADSPVRATTDKDGRFRFHAQPSDFDAEGKATLAAVAKEFGPDWIEITADNKADRALRLVKDDVPIEGRVLDLEGRPIAGVRVSILRIGKRERDADVAPWIEKNIRLRSKGRQMQEDELQVLPAESLVDVPTSTTTKADGGFRLSGLGRERVVRLTIRGPDIEWANLWALTRPGPARGWLTGQWGLYGSTFDWLAGPCKPITGAVRDKATGKPVAGVHVSCPHSIGTTVTTDRQGRYRIIGAGKRKEYQVVTWGVPYLDSWRRDIPDTLGLEPLLVDFQVEQGIEIMGRLIDKSSGKPVPGRVSYLALRDNPNLKKFTMLTMSGSTTRIIDLGRTGRDGTFHTVAIPGPGLLCAVADDVDRFCAAEINELWKTNILPDGFHAVVPLDPAEKDARPVVCDITLEPGRMLKGTVVDPDGRPLKGVFATGRRHMLLPDPNPKRKLESDSFTVTGVKTGRPRTLVFFQPETKLGRVLRLRGDEKEPLTVRLEQLGALAGRVVDRQGRPWAGRKVEVAIYSRGMQLEDKSLPREFLFADWAELTTRKTTTDREGRFRIEGLIPGIKYSLHVVLSEGPQGTGGASFPNARDLIVESGKTRDVGDLKINWLIPEKGVKENP